MPSRAASAPLFYDMAAQAACGSYKGWRAARCAQRAAAERRASVVVLQRAACRELRAFADIILRYLCLPRYYVVADRVSFLPHA